MIGNYLTSPDSASGNFAATTPADLGVYVAPGWPQPIITLHRQAIPHPLKGPIGRK